MDNIAGDPESGEQIATLLFGEFSAVGSHRLQHRLFVFEVGQPLIKGSDDDVGTPYRSALVRLELFHMLHNDERTIDARSALDEARRVGDIPGASGGT